MSKQDVNRLASTGKSGVTQGPGGTGTRHIVIPELPDLPAKLAPSDVAEYRDRCRRWRDQLQAQFPTPA